MVAHYKSSIKYLCFLPRCSRPQPHAHFALTLIKMAYPADHMTNGNCYQLENNPPPKLYLGTPVIYFYKPHEPVLPLAQRLPSQPREPEHQYFGTGPKASQAVSLAPS